MVKIKIAGVLKGFFFLPSLSSEATSIHHVIYMTDFFDLFLSQRGRQGAGDPWQFN